MAEVKDKIITVESLSALYKAMVYQAGDSIDVSFSSTGFVTNEGKSVTFTVPITKPVGSLIATASSDSGFMLKQNGIHTHGCDDSTYVHPETYEVDTNYNSGFIVTATFGEDIDTTGVVNNDIITTVWSGVITLSEPSQ